MGESKSVIDLKQERLKEELLEEPNPLIVKRLESAIKRHKKWEKNKREKLNRINKKKNLT